ncbi:MAG: monofunctional biosynthetic peptidoglycan transglycosylase [Ignavibacterium sp.]|jgi:monofunctional biosynthetic peptidoglycan transglycosylase
MDTPSDPFPENSGGRGPGSARFFLAVKRHPIRTLAVIAACWFTYEIVTLPLGDVTALRHRNPSETAFMKLHEETARDRNKPFRKYHEWVPLREIPPNLINAVVVAEDGTFWRHGGFDWYELKESILQNISSGRAARGASTISQQLVKNLYLSPSKNPLRKIREWVLTWWLERNVGKARILEIYLNVIELGDGVYGVGAASHRYFGKPVSELSREEAVRLAAIIPRPRRFRPDDFSSRYVSRRAELILERMAARGM